MLSVIVPVYNVVNEISKCLKTLEDQTLKGIEYIIVDDGSTDGSGEICDCISSKRHFIKVIHKKNSGLMSAWIEGIKISTGDYIGFVDSDDYISVKMFETMYKIAKNRNCDIVMCNHMYIKDKVRILNKQIVNEGIYTGKNLNDIKQKIFPIINRYYISPSRCNKIFRKSILKDNLKFCDQNIYSGEDVNIVIPSILSCKSFYFINKPFYKYVIRKESLSYKYRSNLIITYIILLDKVRLAIIHYRIKLPQYVWDNTVSYYGYLFVRAILNSKLSYDEKKINIIKFKNIPLFYNSAIRVRRLREKDIYVYMYYQIIKNQNYLIYNLLKVYQELKLQIK